MRLGIRITTALVFALLCTGATALAQTPSSAAQSVESLRAQLRDVQAKEVELQERARKLDEDLKPENIERSLALVGSTKPEELREQRRLQLEKERSSVRAQLEQLQISRTRLEASIVTAEGEAYRQSALPASTTPQPQVDSNQTTVSQPTVKRTGTRSRRSRPRRRRN